MIIDNYFNELLKKVQPSANGTYSDEQLYSIGYAFKFLVPIKQRSWNDLVAYLNLHQSGDAFRKWIERRIKKDLPICNEVKEFMKDMVIPAENVMPDAQNEDTLKQIIMEKQKNRDILNTYNRKIRDEARIELFKDALVSEIRNLKPLTNTYKYTSNANTTNEGILLLSDWHIGVECDNFYNTYNYDVAVKSVDKLVANTIEYCRTNNVKVLNVCNMGDMIHGIIHTNARIEQEFDVTKQIICASELMANALNKLQEAAPKIVYRSVIDNHSRAVANKSEHIEKENFNKLIDWYVQTRLANTSIEFDTKCNIEDGIGLFKLNNNKSFLFAHGHEDSKTTVAQNYVFGLKEYIDYIALAHFHSSVTKNFQNCRVFINGSLVGTEQYALSHRLFSQPSQKLLVFNSRNDNIIDIDIMVR